MGLFEHGAEAGAAAAAGGRFARTEFFKLENDGDIAVLRFMTDYAYNEAYPHIPDWPRTDMHGMVPTKAKPSDWPEGATWPTKMQFVCRRTKVNRKGDTLYDDCYICDNMRDSNGKPLKTTSKQWALAIVREQQIVDGKRRIVDKMKEIKYEAKDGKPERTETVPDIVVVNMSWGNFFAPLAGHARVFGTETILDRDFAIVRQGAAGDTATKYSATPLDPVFVADSAGQRVQFDLRNPEIFEYYKQYAPDLEAFILERCSEEFYARFVDPTKTVATQVRGNNGNGQTTVTTVAAAPPPEEEPVQAVNLAALKDRVRGHPQATPGDGAPAPVASPVPVAAAPAPAPSPQAPAAAPEPAGATAAPAPSKPTAGFQQVD